MDSEGDSNVSEIGLLFKIFYLASIKCIHVEQMKSHLHSLTDTKKKRTALHLVFLIRLEGNWGRAALCPSFTQKLTP